MKKLHADSIEAWRKWLAEHHDREDVVWLVFRKKGKGPVPFDYQAALDEALCMGWVDSLLKKIDEASYMRKFTPRKASSTWSERNKERVEHLILEGRMRPEGMPPGAQKQFNIWINMAKRAETVRKRVDESISLLEKGKELGLK